MKALNYGIVRIDDADYPTHLRSIKDAPEMMYYIGDISLIRYPLIAIVGTRRCSPYGRWAAREIASRVARCGVPVISGMAEGIDSAAHWGCLDTGTPTVAVLGTGIDVVFPKSNVELYRRISENGLILSEYRPGEVGLPSHFPRRNRIISGLSKSVIVVEGALKSGSMITAGLALEQGRDVYSLPGNINQPNSMGTNKLISDGAFPILELDGLAELLGIGDCSIRTEISMLSDNEKLILGTVIGCPGSNAEYIALKTGLSVRDAAVISSALELKGYLRSEGQRLYVSR